MTSPPHSTPPYAQRLQTLRESMAHAGIDGLIVTHPPNLRYLVGFDGSVGALIVAPSRSVLVVDGRYLTSASQRIAEHEDLAEVSVVLAEPNAESTIARAIMAGERIWNLGVEAAAISLSRFDRLSEALGMAEAGAEAGASAPRLRSTEDVVERGRLVKDDYEISRLRIAAARLSEVARGMATLIRRGRTEQEIAADIDAAIRRAGFERPAFETIVASGLNSALPHARPGSRVLQPRDGVVLDFGGVYDGYCVDLTRTVQLAPQTDAYGRLFDAVKAAHAAAIAAVRPGVTATAIDQAARDEIERRGLADAFVHGTGHGLGLEVHEAPRVSKAGSGHPDVTLQPGMVFTIEPGVYLPGLGGVRIEDDVLVVEAGCEILTDVPIDLTVTPQR